MSAEGGARPKISPPGALPTGEVTFLFSDIEGSTHRWEAHHEAMKAAVARHEQLMSSAVARHGGYVFKSMGDAFCAAFNSAPDAIGAAIDAQRALSEEDFSDVDGLRVRMGLHTGEAQERDADYFGPTVNRVARLMALGHGGQVLLSGATRGLAQGHLPSIATFVDLRTHRLKDLTEPEHVWQLTIGGLTENFPPLRSPDAQPNNLPIQRTTFVGRGQDVEEVKKLLSEHRLLTLSGSGGVGKTRLALQVGADLLVLYPDGVWFADLAPIGDPELVASVVANVVGMGQRGGQRLDEAIPQWMKRKHLLLILDNCEHVLETVASLADAIIATASDVRILSTSRQALGIAGEVVHRLPSLAVPVAGGLRAADALGYGAIALFADRAKAADTRFTLADDTAPIIAEICRRLDGIPMAIELAAARVKVLSIQNLAQRLDDRFKLLTGGSRTALPRQKTLGALIDWSYDLLSPPEQTIFNRVSIFAGGFGPDAAATVCGHDGLDGIDVLDLLWSLTDKSLVVADTTGERERYRLLESTRAYAMEKLATRGERDRLAFRHAAYFREQAEALENSRSSESTAAWLASVELELDNYRAALEWALNDGHDVVLGGAVAGALGRLWSHGGFEVEGRYWIARAQAGLDESAHPHIAARLWQNLAVLSAAKRKHEYAQRALALYESVGDDQASAWSLYYLGHGLYQMGRLEEASEAIGRALTAMRACEDLGGAAWCLYEQAVIRRYLGDVTAAREMFTQAFAAFKNLKNESGTGAVLGNLAEMEFGDGRIDQAVRLAEETIQIHSRVNRPADLANSYTNSATYRIALGDMDGAREEAREGLRLARQVQNALVVTWALQHLALLLGLRGDVRGAGQLIGYVDAQYRELGAGRESTESWGYEKLMVVLREHLSEGELERLATEGASWSEDQAVEKALKA